MSFCHRAALTTSFAGLSGTTGLTGTTGLEGVLSASLLGFDPHPPRMHMSVGCIHTQLTLPMVPGTTGATGFTGTTGLKGMYSWLHMPSQVATAKLHHGAG